MVGEVIVKSPTVMSVYYNNIAATNQAICTVDESLYTGDIVSLDRDGFLTLIDRSKDVIISAAPNIYPREVEEVVLKHKSILETSVVGKRDR